MQRFLVNIDKLANTLVESEEANAFIHLTLVTITVSNRSIAYSSFSAIEYCRWKLIRLEKYI